MRRVRGLSPDMRALVTEYVNQGWEVSIVKGTTHLRWTRPDGKSIQTGYTVRGRGVKNARARLERFRKQEEEK